MKKRKKNTEPTHTERGPRLRDDNRNHLLGFRSFLCEAAPGPRPLSVKGAAPLRPPRDSFAVCSLECHAVSSERRALHWLSRLPLGHSHRAWLQAHLCPRAPPHPAEAGPDLGFQRHLNQTLGCGTKGSPFTCMVSTCGPGFLLNCSTFPSFHRLDLCIPKIWIRTSFEDKKAKEKFKKKTKHSAPAPNL